MLVDVCKYVDPKSSAARMAIKSMSAGVAPEVSLRNPLHADDEGCKRGIQPGFKTRCPKHGYQWPHE